MSTRLPRYSKEEFARRGNELYQTRIRSQVEAGNHGKVVAIDIDSGAFAVGDDTLQASETLLSQHPQAQIWCVRVGYPAVHRLGTFAAGVRR